MKKRFLMAVFAILLLLSCFKLAPVQTQAASSEYKAVWFSYYDYSKYRAAYKVNTAANFTTYFDSVLDACKTRGFNTIIVHVRAFSDAMYQSSYFPTSAYIAGKQGTALSYDPLSIMVAEAHKKGLKIEAWINPYRVANNTNYKKLSKWNPARIWHYSKNASDRRNVLSYGGKLYYNPSSPAVRQLIINGVSEIVSRYAVDGIHMDDYFYPTFSAKNVAKTFDYKEYKASAEKASGMTIANYRRKQVNLLVSGIYSTIKSIRPSCTFGISPAGNIANLTSNYSYYCDIYTWCRNTGYVDYIAPQIYWGFNHRTAKFNVVLGQWKSVVDQSKVKLYVGLPAYKMGYKTGTTTAEKKEFKTATTLATMISYSRQVGVNGFAVFDYSDIIRSNAGTYMNYMTLELNKK